MTWSFTLVPRNLRVSGLRALGDPDTRLYVTAHLLLSVASQGLEPCRFALTAIYLLVRGRLGCWGWPHPFLALRGSLGLASPH